jgi:hypothetical protein
LTLFYQIGYIFYGLFWNFRDNLQTLNLRSKKIKIELSIFLNKRLDFYVILLGNLTRFVVKIVQTDVNLTPRVNTVTNLLYFKYVEEFPQYKREFAAELAI